MKLVKQTLSTLLLLFVCITLSQATQAAQKRFALVIGNSAYEDAPLKNPRNDATDMAQTLQSAGFQVVKILDATKKQMQTAITKFHATLLKNPNSIALFYFAGHGFQHDDKNYLVPIGAALNSPSSVNREALDMNNALDAMKEVNTGLNIVIMDCCRNPLFARSRSLAMSKIRGSGLGVITYPKGSFIGYATDPGNVAADGQGRNGTYTKHLLKSIQTPGLSIEKVFKRTLIGVEQETGGEQTPWVSSAFSGKFKFIESKVEKPDFQPSGLPGHKEFEQATLFKDRGQYAEARPLFQKAADRGHTEAQRELAHLLRQGRGGAEDLTGAINLYRRAAVKGDIDSQFWFGMMNYNGEGTKRNFKVAAAWLLTAAERGDIYSQSRLGLMYQRGQGVEQDDNQALIWYKTAGSKGYKAAQYRAGELLFLIAHRGEKSRDPAVKARSNNLYKEARTWLLSAAGQNFDLAQDRLGDLFYFGLGVDKNFQEAADWYTRAARQGHKESQFALGEMYTRGQGLPKNTTKAITFYTQAAKQNHQLAMIRLGDLYSRRQQQTNETCRKASLWYKKALEILENQQRSTIDPLLK